MSESPERPQTKGLPNSSLPNQRLIQDLLTTYFQDGSGPDAQSPFVSSYWAHHSELFDVQSDDAGNLTSLMGSAVPSCKWDNAITRALDNLCYISHLVHLPHRKEIIQLRALAARVCRSMDLDPTMNVLRQVYTLETIKRNLPPELHHKPMKVLIIGDGCGILSALFKAVFRDSTVVLVDIGRTLLFQAYYCQKAHPQSL